MHTSDFEKCYDVFISHSSKSADIATAICEYLEKKDINCWIAPRNIQGGKRFAEEIIDGICNSVVFVIIFSSDSNTSPDVETEVATAFRHHIPIIQYRIEDIPFSKFMEYYLAHVQWIDATKNPSNGRIPKLAESIKLYISAEKNKHPKKLHSQISDNPDTHYNLGIILDERGQLTDAIKEYEKAIDLMPNDVESHYNLGIIFYKLKQFEKAIKEFETVIQINPNDADSHYYLGNILCEMNKVDDAEKEYHLTIKIDKNHAEAHNNLGVIFDANGKLEDAIKEYRKAIKIDPDFAEAFSNLAIDLEILRNMKLKR